MKIFFLITTIALSLYSLPLTKKAIVKKEIKKYSFATAIQSDTALEHQVAFIYKQINEVKLYVILTTLALKKQIYPCLFNIKKAEEQIMYKD